MLVPNKLSRSSSPPGSVEGRCDSMARSDCIMKVPSLGWYVITWFNGKFISHEKSDQRNLKDMLYPKVGVLSHIFSMSMEEVKT
jgi:hypothetical protein